MQKGATLQKAVKEVVIPSSVVGGIDQEIPNTLETK